MDFKGGITRQGYDLHNTFVVNSIAERDAIPTELLKPGATCRVFGTITRGWEWDGTAWRADTGTGAYNVYSLNFYTQAYNPFIITIIDTTRGETFATLPHPGLGGNANIALPLNFAYLISYSDVHGYTSPQPVSGVTSGSGGGASINVEYGGFRMSIFNDESIGAHVTVEDADTGGILFERDFTSWNVQDFTLPIGMHYLLTATFTDTDNTTRTYAGTTTAGAESIHLRLPGASLTMYNQNNHHAANVVVYNNETDAILSPSCRLLPGTSFDTKLIFEESLTYRIEAIYEDPDASIFKQTQTVFSGENKYITIYLQEYYIRLYHTKSYSATYIVKNTVTGDTLAEEQLLSYGQKQIRVPIGTLYSVELEPQESLELVSDTFTGEAIIPDGYGGSYEQQVSLHYLPDNTPYVYIYYHIPQLPQLPPLTFSIRKMADNSLIHSGIVQPDAGYNYGSYYYVMKPGLIAYVHFEEMEDYIVGADQDVIMNTSSKSVYIYPTYFFVLIYNSNPFAVPYAIVDADTEEVLREGVVSSSYQSDYMPVRPGRNYRIDYGAVAGYVTPASVTGTAGNNSLMSFEPAYVAS